jgi:hypothetical protein
MDAKSGTYFYFFYRQRAAQRHHEHYPGHENLSLFKSPPAPARFQIQRTILHKSRAACKMVCGAGARKPFVSLPNEFADNNAFQSPFH